MKNEEKIPWKCSLILCHSKASFKRATGTREENYNMMSLTYSLGQAFQHTAGRNKVSPLTELLKKLL